MCGDPKQEASHGVPFYITWFLDHGNKLPTERIKRKKCYSLPFMVGRFYSPISSGLRNSPVALSIIIFTQNPQGAIIEEIILENLRDSCIFLFFWGLPAFFSFQRSRER